MPDDPTPPLAAVSSAEALATLISTIAEQNRLIKLLTERVGALEGCSPASRATTAGSPITPANDTQPIPDNDINKGSNTPDQPRVLDSQIQPTSIEENLPEDSAVLPANSSSVEHTPVPSPPPAPEANASAASSAPPVLPAAAPLRHEAPPFLPMHPPPSFGYQPYWPHPGYHHPMYSPYPPHWYPPPNHPSAAGHAIASSHPGTPTHNVNPVKTSGGSSNVPTNEPATASLDQWGSEPATSWGELEGNSAQKSPSKSEVHLDSNDNPKSAANGKSKVRSCKFGEECTRSDCWFEHPDRVNSALQPHNDNPNSTHAPNSKMSNSEAGTSSDATTKQPKSSAKSMPECRYAGKCTREKCWFTHPPGWSPPSRTPESMPDQLTPMPNDQPGDQEHAASSVSNEWPTEYDGRDTKNQENTADETNTDLRTWGTETTNDWGTPTIDDWGPSTNNDWGAPSNDGWASPAVKTAVAQGPSSASKSKQTPPAKKPNSETRKGRKSRSARSRESTASSVRSQSVLSVTTTQLETVDDVHDTVTEPPADASVPDPVIEPSAADIIVDSLSTPSLEPATPTPSSSLSEPESLSTPFAWGDEPLDDSNHIDPPAKDPTDLDTAAPSAMYTSWAPVEVSDWGPITVDSPSDANGVDNTMPPVSQTDQEYVGGQPSAKAKGKRKETDQGKAAAASRAKDKRKPANEAGPSTASTSAVPDPPAEPAAVPEPSPVPQGVPEEQIPDWLLGKGEDSYAVLGLSRPATPEPVPAPKPSAPKPGLNRPRLSQMPGESFPALKPSPAYQPPATSVASGPVIQPARRTGWKIIPIDASATSAPSKGAGQSKKNHVSKNKQAGKVSK